MFPHDGFLRFHHPFIDCPIGIGEVAGLPFAADALRQPVTYSLLRSLDVAGGYWRPTVVGQFSHIFAARLQVIGSIKHDALPQTKSFFDDGVAYFVN